MDFFTSDLHLFHKNICEFTDRKLVTNVEFHQEWLIDLWNSQVSAKDTVYILGDVSFGKYQETAEVLNRMHGFKIVVEGNHDNQKMLQSLKANGVIQDWTQYKVVKIEDTSTVLFHFPIGSWYKQGHGSWHLHGHSHGNYADTKGKMLDVGIDNSFNVYGEHCLFSKDDIVDYMQYQEIYTSDLHRSSARSQANYE